MKKIISILLIAMLLTTGCSLIGQKNTDDEPIIPLANDTQNDPNTVANAAVNADTAGNSGSALTSVSGSSVDSSSISSSLSEDLAGILNEIGIDNGTGDGMTSNSSDKSSILLTLYYRDSEGMLVPVTRSVQKQEGLAKAAISGLVDEAVTREQLDYYGLYPVLPQGTKIKGLSIKNGSAVIDFSKEFLNTGTKAEEQRAVAAVVYTLTGFKTISDVTIWVDGKAVGTLDNGTSLSGIRNRQNTFINSDETPLKDGFVKCDLYYLSSGGSQFSYLIPVSTQLEKAESSKFAIEMFEQLAKKPEGTKYYTSFPEGTKLLSCDLQNDLAVLDFSSQISGYGGNEKEDSILGQIYYTINQFKGIQKAKILIDGKETPLPEGTEVAVSTSLPATFNKVVDK